MKLIVGLGNPGKKYLLTPHNIGWIVVDALAHQLEVSWQAKKKFSSEIASVDTEKILLVKPLTYMNLSGKAVKSLINFYRLNPSNDLLVIHDDIDLPFLSLRFQKNRGPAGHNGLKNINEELGTQDYTRLRIGMKKQEEVEPSPSEENKQKKEQWSLSHIPMNIGLPVNYTSSETQVLKTFTKAEQGLLSDFLNPATEAIQYFLSDGLEKAANRYNST